MPLRLAGEDYAVVQGLDDLGRLRAITVNDASPGLKINQQGAGSSLELQAAGAARLALTNAGQLQLPVQGSGGGLLVGGDVSLYRVEANRLGTDGGLRLGNGLFMPNNLNLYMKSLDGTDQPLLMMTTSDNVQFQNPVASRSLIFKTGGVQRAEFNATTGDLSLGAQKLILGTFGAEDVNLYRNAANVLRTDDDLMVGPGGGGSESPVVIINAGANGAPTILWQQNGVERGQVYGNVNGLTLLGALAMNNSLSLTEIADPAAPSADVGRVYVRDNGAGKTQLVVRFPTGAVQVLATEP